MAVAETSKEAYEKRRPKVGTDQYAVLRVVEEYGPIFDAMILHKLQLADRKKPRYERRKRPWGINKVTPRRGELESDYRLVICIGEYYIRWEGQKMKVKIFRARGDSRRPENYGYEPAEVEQHIPSSNISEVKEKRFERRARAEAPVLAALATGRQRLLFT